jgi:hypothetical protein
MATKVFTVFLMAAIFAEGATAQANSTISPKEPFQNQLSKCQSLHNIHKVLSELRNSSIVSSPELSQNEAMRLN